MIVNFRSTKAFLIRFFILASIAANVYAVICLNQAETSLEGCEKYIEQITAAGARLAHK